MSKTDEYYSIRIHPEFLSKRLGCDRATAERVAEMMMDDAVLVDIILEQADLFLEHIENENNGEEA